MRTRRDSLGDAGGELRRLRSSGYSVVEAMYIVANVFEIPLSEAKRLAMTRGSDGADSYVDEFHSAAEDHFRN